VVFSIGLGWGKVLYMKEYDKDGVPHRCGWSVGGDYQAVTMYVYDLVNYLH
jgi:hypothetical protein